ncbi:hypothetical protein DIPPA_07404 [Diplonema papillatum]|nr:hypothetical protein DIPPA_07404 [Diplonema papillatum]
MAGGPPRNREVVGVSLDGGWMSADVGCSSEYSVENTCVAVEGPGNSTSGTSSRAKMPPSVGESNPPLNASVEPPSAGPVTAAKAQAVAAPVPNAAPTAAAAPGAEAPGGEEQAGGSLGGFRFGSSASLAGVSAGRCPKPPGAFGAAPGAGLLAAAKAPGVVAPAPNAAPSAAAAPSGAEAPVGEEKSGGALGGSRFGSSASLAGGSVGRCPKPPGAIGAAPSAGLLTSAAAAPGGAEAPVGEEQSGGALGGFRFGSSASLAGGSVGRRPKPPGAAGSRAASFRSRGSRVSLYAVSRLPSAARLSFSAEPPAPPPGGVRPAAAAGCPSAVGAFRQLKEAAARGCYFLLGREAGGAARGGRRFGSFADAAAAVRLAIRRRRGPHACALPSQPVAASTRVQFVACPREARPSSGACSLEVRPCTPPPRTSPAHRGGLGERRRKSSAAQTSLGGTGRSGGRTAPPPASPPPLPPRPLVLRHPCEHCAELLAQLDGGCEGGRVRAGADLVFTALALDGGAGGAGYNRAEKACFDGLLRDAAIHPSTATRQLAGTLGHYGIDPRGLALLLFSLADDAGEPQFAAAPLQSVGRLLAVLLPFARDAVLLSSFDEPAWLTEDPRLDDYMYQRYTVLRHFFTPAAAPPSPGSAPAMPVEAFVAFAATLKAHPQFASRHLLRRIYAAAGRGAPSVGGLREAEFHDAVVRLSHALFSKPELLEVVPAASSLFEKVDAFFSLFVGPAYTARTGAHVEARLDTVLAAPTLRSVAPASGAAGTVLRIQGKHFCSKRGVRVQFGTVVTACHRVEADHCLVAAPEAAAQPFSPFAYKAEAYERLSGCVVEVQWASTQKLAVANNRVWVEPPLKCSHFVYQRVVLSFEVSDALFDAVKEAHAKLPHRVPVEKLASLAGLACPSADEVRGSAVPHLLRDPMSKPRFLVSILATLACWARSKCEADLHSVPAAIDALFEPVLKAFAAFAAAGAGDGGLSERSSALSAARADMRHMAGRPPTAYNVYAGPRFLGVLREDGEFEAPYDAATQLSITITTAPCTGFLASVSRLLAFGYFVEPALSRVHCPAARQRVGRCWTVAFKGSVLGFAWDHPGTLTTSDWFPVVGSLAHPNLSLHLAFADCSAAAVPAIYTVFSKGGPIGSFRDELSLLGFVFTTVLP